MTFYNFHIIFLIYILFKSCFVNSFTIISTEAQYKGYKTLWKPYSQWYFPEIKRRNQSDAIIESTASVPRRTTYVTLDWNYKRFFMKQDYDYDYPPGIMQLMKSTVPKSRVTKEFQLVHDKDWRRWQFDGSEPGLSTKDVSIPNLIPQPKRQTRPRLIWKKLNTTSSTAPQEVQLTRKRNMMSRSRRNTSCYVCGLNLPGIPRQPACYHVFNNDDQRFMFQKNSFKRRCVVGKRGQPPTNRYWYGELYRGGCFKRFTDVGIEYNERGCRTMEPTRGLSFASKRFARLEKILYDVDDGCVASPSASLTPFSRAISLYVRYHVCVCKGKYCNQAPRTHPSYIGKIRLFSLLFIAVFKK